MGLYFFDTEFWERPVRAPRSSPTEGYKRCAAHTIELISIGIVTPDGREFYAENSEFAWDRPDIDPWLHENVKPHLNGSLMSLEDIRDNVDRFVVGKKPRFFAWYADYDWVVFCSLYGRMADLPDRYRRYCIDIKQMADGLGNPELPEQPEGEHNALADARHNLVRYTALLDGFERDKALDDYREGR